MARKDTHAEGERPVAIRRDRAGQSTLTATFSFAELMAAPEVQWPDERRPVSAQEHKRRRAIIESLVERRFDAKTAS